MQLQELIALARQQGASDVHISESLPVFFRVDGQLRPAPLAQDGQESAALIRSLLDGDAQARLDAGQDLDFALTAPDGSRQRVNIFRQQGRLAAAIRLLNDHIPTLEELRLPAVLARLAERPNGLVLVTGPTGSGKSTTLAAMIGHILRVRPCHVLTIEDPIEYVYAGGLIHQREVGRDVPGFAAALRSALREDPDVILVGEMRDYETIQAAVTAAETGHLVLSTLHTIGAAHTIDRIIDACPAGLQGQMRGQLAAILRGIVTQQLLPLAGGAGRCPATEVLVGTEAVGNLIRENKCFQLASLQQAGAAQGMHTLAGDLARLVAAGTITRADALRAVPDARELEMYL